MRSLILATAFVVASALPVEAAMAQQTSAPVAKQPMRPGLDGRWKGNWRPGAHWNGSRWGGRVNGRWFAGYRAPGGWMAYRAPVVGWVLPTYWYAPRFYVNDWARYGLPAPADGRVWTRYYDDAVQVDHHGRVHDHRKGVAWDDDDTGYRHDDRGRRQNDDKHRHDPDGDYPIAPDDDYAGPGAPYPAPGYHGDYPPPPPMMRREHRVEVPAGHHGPYTEVIHGPGTVTTVTVIPGSTTTTRTVEYVPAVTYKRVYRGKATKLLRR